MSLPFKPQYAFVSVMMNRTAERMPANDTEDRWEKARWRPDVFLGTLALQAFKFHIRSQTTQRPAHRKTTDRDATTQSRAWHRAFPGPMPSTCMKKLWDGPSYRLILPREESWVRLTPPLNLVNQQLQVVIVFQGHLFFWTGNQNHVQTPNSRLYLWGLFS